MSVSLPASFLSLIALLANDGEIIAEGLVGVEKAVRLGGQIAFEDGLTFGAQDVHEHGPGVPIDAGIELVCIPCCTQNYACFSP